MLRSKCISKIKSSEIYRNNNINKRGEIHLAVILSTTLCIARQNLSKGVNVVCEGSPSRMRKLRRISFGITTLPKSSIRRTIPVAVPDFCSALHCFAAKIDRCHSLASLFLPQAALASFPRCFHI